MSRPVNQIEGQRTARPFTVACPICGAQPGFACRGVKPGGARLIVTPHIDRLRVYNTAERNAKDSDLSVRS